MHSNNSNINKNILKGKVYLFFSFLLIILINCTLINITKAQAHSDSVITKNIHSPRKAALMSAILPGLGQVYNKQYWKVPILYAGVATLTYFYINNNKSYQSYKTEYTHRMNNDSIGLNPTYTNYSTEGVLQLRDYYEHNYELTIIISAAVYMLNIIDASVYGHLFSFDVGSDLSLKLEPVIYNSFNSSNNAPSGGFKLSLRF